MKRGLLIFALCVVPISSLILVIGTMGLSGFFSSSPAPERSRWAAYLITAAENPYLRPWVERTVQLLQDNPALARQVATYGRAPDLVRPETVAEPEQYLLTFPHTANGGSGVPGPTIISSVLLLNNGGANAEGTITLRKTDGSPLVVNTNLGRGSQFDFALLSGQELRLETDGTGPVEQGWVEVVSDVKISGSGLFTVLDSQGRFTSEVGIGDSVRATKLMVFVDTTDGKSTGVGICNPNAAGTANVTYTLRGLDGMQVAQSPPDQIEAGHQKAFFVADTFGSVDLSNFKGVLVIESDLPVSVVTLRTRGLNFTSLPAVPEAEGGEDDYFLFFARIGDGVFGPQGFATSIIFLNNSDMAVPATVDLFGADGSPLELTLDGQKASSFEVEVPAGGGAELVSDGSTNPGVVGWIQVQSSQPLAGGATFVITERSGGKFVSEVGIPSSPLDSKPGLVARVGGGVSTGVALTNPNEIPVVAKLRLSGTTISDAAPAGRSSPQNEAPDIIAESTLNLGAFSHEGLFVVDLFPQVPAVKAQDFQGRLEIEAYAPEFGEIVLAPVTGLTLFLRTSSLGTSLTSAPLAPFVTNFGPVTVFRPATRLAGAEPSFCLASRQLQGEFPLGRAVITVDSASIDFSRFRDSEFFGKSTSTLLFFHLAGPSFPTDIMSDSSLFFAPITFDGASESNLFWASITNLPQGGIQFEILSNAVGDLPGDVLATSQLCFNAELLQLPGNAGATIRVTEQYESQELDEEAVPLESTRFSLLSLEGLPNGSPRIDSVDALQIVGGQEIVLKGSFAANAANNQVTVEGNSRVPATVLSSSGTQLRVRLPNDVASGPLRVEAGGQTSNDYELDVIFAPRSGLEFSGSPGSDSNLHFELNQRRGELLFMEAELRPSQGEWITSGFSVGENIGSVQIIGSDDSSTLELLVASSETNRLTLEAVESGQEDPELTVEVSNEGNRPFVVRLIDDLGFPAVIPADTRTILATSRAVFRRPAGAFEFTAIVTSQPERPGVPETALTTQQTLPQ